MANTGQSARAAVRLDRLLVERRYFPSREKAVFSIRAGGVRVDGRALTKPAATVNPHARIEVDTRSALRIGRGERKLAGVLERFGIDCAGKVALDVGSGAGGFTWRLLQLGAARVYAVDVGRDQLHPELRADPQVTVFEQTDARQLTALPIAPHLAVIDVSFISLRAVLPPVRTVLRADAAMVALLKPQFETATVASAADAGLTPAPSPRRPETQDRIRAAFRDWCAANALTVRDEMASPLPGKHGTREVFFHLTNANSGAPASSDLSRS